MIQIVWGWGCNEIHDYAANLGYGGNVNMGGHGSNLGMSPVLAEMMAKVKNLEYESKMLKIED